MKGNSGGVKSRLGASSASASEAAVNTPLIASVMYYITYHPYWHSPDHLVRKTIAPNVLHLGMGYLKSHGYHVIADWSEHPTVIDPLTVGLEFLSVSQQNFTSLVDGSNTTA